MGQIVTDVAELKGIEYTFTTDTFQMTAGGYSYTFTLAPQPEVPTTYGIITAGAGTYTTW